MGNGLNYFPYNKNLPFQCFCFQSIISLDDNAWSIYVRLQFLVYFSLHILVSGLSGTNGAGEVGGKTLQQRAARRGAGRREGR